MKRFVVLVGGAGARMMDALICAAGAGVYPGGEIEVLLADVDQRGVQGAAMLQAHLADYTRVQEAVMASRGAEARSTGFRTALRLHAWPRQLPGGASTFAEMTSGEELDALLCQALFDQEASELELAEGFHGRPMLAQVGFAGLLEKAAEDESDPLHALVREMARAAQAGEDVRVVLAGSVCSGTGAAGIPALARFIRERTPGNVRMGAVLMAAVTDQQDDGKAREAIRRYARDGLCEAVCVLGLPRSSCPSAPAELARLTDWLGVYCMDVMLHRPTWLDGVFTVRAPEGPLSWSIFGKAAQRYRQGYGSLFKTALALTAYVGPEAARRLKRPFFLRDMLGWYGHYYRRMETTPEEEMETLAALTRLMKVMLLWLGGVCRTLPADLRHATRMGRARRQAAAHYDGLTERVSHLCVLDNDLHRNEEFDDAVVHRHYTPEETDAEQTLGRIDAVKREIGRQEAEQAEMNAAMGGPAVLDMLESALHQARTEQAALREKYADAVRRIDHAAAIATEEEQYRITDARTKLKRIDRHQLMLDSRVERIREDLEAAVTQEVRFERPVLEETEEENALLDPRLAGRLLKKDPVTCREAEDLWGKMVLPGETIGLRQALKHARHSRADRLAPTISLMNALMETAMEEVKP